MMGKHLFYFLFTLNILKRTSDAQFCEKILSLDTSISASNLCAPMSPIYYRNMISNDIVIGTSNGLMHVVNVEGGIKKMTMNKANAHTGAIDQVRHLDDSDSVFSLSSTDKTLKIWSITTGEMIMSIPLGGEPLNFTLEPTSKTIWVIYKNKELILYNIADGSLQYSFGVINTGNIVAMELLQMDPTSIDFNKYMMLVDDKKMVNFVNTKTYKTSLITPYDLSTIVEEDIVAISNVYNTKKFFLTTNIKIYMFELSNNIIQTFSIFEHPSTVRSMSLFKNNIVITSSSDNSLYVNSYDPALTFTPTLPIGTSFVAMAPRSRKGSDSIFCLDCNSIYIVYIDALYGLSTKIKFKISQANLNGIQSISIDSATKRVAVGDNQKSMGFIYDWYAPRKISSFDLGVEPSPLSGVQFLSGKLAYFKNKNFNIYSLVNEAYQYETTVGLASGLNNNKLVYDSSSNNVIMAVGTQVVLYSVAKKTVITSLETNGGAIITDVEKISNLNRIISCGGDPNYKVLQSSDLQEVSNGNIGDECISVCELKEYDAIILAGGSRVSVYSRVDDPQYLSSFETNKKISKLICLSGSLFAIYFVDKSLEIWDAKANNKKYSLRVGVDFASFSALPATNNLFGGSGKYLYIWSLECGTCSDGFCGCPLYKFLDTGVCKDCDQSCETCSAATAESCTICRSGYFRQLNSANCLTTCSSTSFPDPSTRTCKVCDPSCASCSGPSNQNCLTCNPNTFFTSNKCVSSTECPVKTYPNSVSQKCESCDNTCTTCDGNSPNSCTSCSAPLFFYKTACLKTDECPEKFYYSSGSNTCLACAQNCLTCLSNLANECKSCVSNFYFSSGSCITAPSCLKGNFFNDVTITCEPCDTSCSTCTGASNQDCNSCKDYSYLYLKKCVLSSECPAKFYADKSTWTCSACLDTCATCDEPGKCLACIENRLKDFNGLCVEPSACPEKTFPNLGTLACESCDSKCLKCDGPTPLSCTLCLVPLYLYQRSCLKPEECPEKTYFSAVDKTCLNCFSSCQTCTSSAENECKSCNENYFFTSGSCVESCLCPEGTYPLEASKICDSCYEKCKTCKNKAQNGCLSCASSFFLFTGSCLIESDCPSNTYPDTANRLCTTCHLTCMTCSGPSEKDCTGCKPDSYKTATGECLKCNPKCYSCTAAGENSCSQCNTGFYFNYEKVCVSGDQCPADSFSDPESRTCERCDSSCASCTGLTNEKCKSCKEGWYLTGTKCVAAPGCPSDTFANSVTKACSQCHDSCSTCTGSGKVDCKTCKNNFLLSINECVTAENCPVLTYPDLSLKKCNPCHSSCEKCNGATSKSCTLCKENLFLNSLSDCETSDGCFSYFYPRKATRKCESCHNSCFLCSGPLDSDCLVCNQGLLKSPQGKCVQPADCPKGTFADQNAEKCSLCFKDCQTCSTGEAKGCKSCVEGLYLSYENACVNRQECPNAVDDIKYLCMKCADNCEKCEFTNYTGCSSCKDGKYLHKFSCLELCPAGYVASGGVCQVIKDLKDLKEVKVDLVQDKQRLELIYIQFSESLQELSDATFGEKFLSLINIKIQNLPPDNYSIKKSVVNNQNIRLELNLNINLRNIIMEVEMTSLSEIGLRSSNLYFNYTNLKLDLKLENSNLKLEPQLIEETKKSTTVANVQMGMIAVTYFSSSFFFQFLGIIASLVGAAQLCNILMYVNVNYPYNLVKFFQTVGKVNLNFIPDIGKTREEIPHPLGDFKFFNIPVRNQRAPHKFDNMGKSSSFILEGLTHLLIIVSTLLLFLIIKGGNRLTEKRSANDKLKALFSKALSIVEYKLIIQAAHILYFNISLSTFLQFQNVNFGSPITGVSFFLALFCFFCTVVFLVFLLKTAIQFFFLADEEFSLFEKCKDLFDCRKMEKVWQRIYFFIIFLKKYATVFLIVFFHDHPNAVILMMMLIQLFFVIYMVHYKPWENETFNFLEILSESVMFIMLLFVWRIHQLDLTNSEFPIISDEEVATRFRVGWLMIYLFIGLLLAYFFFFLLLTFKNIQDSLEDILIALEAKGKRNLSRMVVFLLCGKEDVKRKLENGFYKNPQNIDKAKVIEKLKQAKTVIELNTRKKEFL